MSYWSIKNTNFGVNEMRWLQEAGAMILLMFIFAYILGVAIGVIL